MLKEYNWPPILEDEEKIKAQIRRRRDLLYRQQQKIKEKALPVLVLVEGWGASGKGSLISYLIQDLDPRFYRVISQNPPTPEERRKPFLCRQMAQIPSEGQFVFFDSGWMQEVIEDRALNGMKKKEYRKRLESIQIFERQLTDNGYLVIKLFLHIPEEIQRKRCEALTSHGDTSWRVSDYDRWQLEHRKKAEKYYDSCMENTNTPAAPWHIIDGRSSRNVELSVYTILTEVIDATLMTRKRAAKLLPNVFPLVDMPKLADVDLSPALTREEYDKQYKKARERLKELHNQIYRHRIPVIIAYEGWDAAGKGGNIKRVTSGLDARGYVVHPIASPEPAEKSRHYLWRFWTRLPKTGHIAVFDRTWYGRVMVERIEGFCKTNDWQRAYNEMNEFEHELVKWGAVVIKFWVQIDKDTQLARFQARKKDPEKRWKITDEDWRNREKWDLYEKAIDEMLKKTSTEEAPWEILQSNNKYYARIQAMQIVIRRLEEALAKVQ